MGYFIAFKADIKPACLHTIVNDESLKMIAIGWGTTLTNSKVFNLKKKWIFIHKQMFHFIYARGNAIICTTKSRIENDAIGNLR